ncbi:protein of unknown function [Paraburkholderia kururiensis]
MSLLSPCRGKHRRKPRAGTRRRSVRVYRRHVAARLRTIVRDSAIKSHVAVFGINGPSGATAFFCPFSPLCPMRGLDTHQAGP